MMIVGLVLEVVGVFFVFATFYIYYAAIRAADLHLLVWVVLGFH